MLTLFVFMLAVERAGCRISRMGEDHCACRKTCENFVRIFLKKQEKKDIFTTSKGTVFQAE